MTEKPKTYGEALVEASRTGDDKALQHVMRGFWGEARKRNLPTPETHPPRIPLCKGCPMGFDGCCMEKVRS